MNLRNLLFINQNNFNLKCKVLTYCFTQTCHYFRWVTRNFSGQEKFLETGALWKPVTTYERKTSQGKIWIFFSQIPLKLNFNWEFQPLMNKITKFVQKNRATFADFEKRGRGDLSPSPQLVAPLYFLNVSNHYFFFFWLNTSYLKHRRYITGSLNLM